MDGPGGALVPLDLPRIEDMEDSNKLSVARVLLPTKSIHEDDAVITSLIRVGKGAGAQSFCRWNG